MTLTNTDIAELRDTWAVLAGDASALTECFYAELFRLAPHYQRLFAGADLDEQQRKLSAALALVVKHAADLTPILGALSDLGRRHADWGVEDGDYAVVGVAMLYAISTRLGSRFSPAARDAWLSAYTAVADQMKSGARAAMKKTA